MRNEIQRRLRRAKDCERRTGKWLLLHDGPDPRFIPGGGIVTATGRVGHITEMQIDCISKRYAAEVKNIQVWAGLWGFWKKIVVRAGEQGKFPLIKIEPTNEDSAGVPNLHIITEERHGELLDAERELNELKDGPRLTVTPLRDGACPEGTVVLKRAQQGQGFPRRATGPLTKDQQTHRKAKA